MIIMVISFNSTKILQIYVWLYVQFCASSWIAQMSGCSENFPLGQLPDICASSTSNDLVNPPFVVILVGGWDQLHPPRDEKMVPCTCFPFTSPSHVQWLQASCFNDKYPSLGASYLEVKGKEKLPGESRFFGWELAKYQVRYVNKQSNSIILNKVSGDWRYRHLKYI